MNRFAAPALVATALLLGACATASDPYDQIPEGAEETAARPVSVELDGRHTRGATIVDWQRQTGAADNALVLVRYDQERFERQVREALAAG